MRQAILEVINVTAGYGDTEVLHDVSLAVYPAEVIGIVGQSGSGKTSLLNCVLQLEPNLEILSGEILYSHQNLLTLNKKEYRRLFQDEIAVIFQNSNFTLVPTRKISSQFYETTRGRLTQVETRQKAYRLFEQLELKNPERIFHGYPFELSIGMAQRVAVSLALMNDPSLLLCDEPTSALDVKSAFEMVRQLKQLKEEKGMTMVVVTHNIALAAQLCDRIAVIHQGHIVEVQDTKTLIESPMHAYTKQLLASLPKTEDLWNG
jgi:oligopeptide ABC transporter, ATP-binding protein